MTTFMFDKNHSPNATMALRDPNHIQMNCIQISMRFMKTQIK